MNIIHRSGILDYQSIITEEVAHSISMTYVHRELYMKVKEVTRL